MTSSARWLHQLSAIVPAQKWVRGVKLDEREDSGRKEANQESCYCLTVQDAVCPCGPHSLPRGNRTRKGLEKGDEGGQRDGAIKSHHTGQNSSSQKRDKWCDARLTALNS